jgi:hypothetical protein
MAIWKMPPKAKVYEALSAFTDGRVNLVGPAEAEVTSSGGDKKYLVKWSDDMMRFSSNDNASYWQGYIGYPIIAVLLVLGRIKFDSKYAAHLSGVNWKKINNLFKRDYDKAVASVLDEIEAKGEDRNLVIQQVEIIYAKLADLKLERGVQSIAPPTSK